jgi:hypothetical protein
MPTRPTMAHAAQSSPAGIRARRLAQQGNLASAERSHCQPSRSRQLNLQMKSGVRSEELEWLSGAP